MWYRNGTWLALAAAPWILNVATALAAGAPAANAAAVDKAFEALKSFDWGTDRTLLKPIDDAVIAAHDNAALQKELEPRLVAVLKTGANRDAKDFVCRKLMLIGTAASVPALAELLPDKDNSHMARYALERIAAAEAARALRDALPTLSGSLKVGVIASLGVRRDAASVPALAALLADADQKVACASMCALGDIGNSVAAKALNTFAKKAPNELKPALADALLTNAERLLADGKKAEAILIYKSLSGEDQSKLIRLAATHGLLAAAGKKD
jgi:HEAT repeat protein